MLKVYLKIIQNFLRELWSRIGVVLLYITLMWAFLVVACYLIIGDFWRSAGIVSSLIMFNIVKTEFYKEFFGNRHGIQEQKKRK